MTSIVDRAKQIQRVLVAAAEVAADAGPELDRAFETEPRVCEVGIGPIHRLKKALKELEK